MSVAPPWTVEGGIGGQKEALQFAGDKTPKSEVPAPGDAYDYFSAKKPASSADSLPALSRTISITPAPIASEVTARGQLHVPDTTSLLSPVDRPHAHSQVSSLSIESTGSNATVTAASVGGASATAPQTRPAFPNQSYAALHSQHYPVRHHPPPVLRQRSSHPGQILTFTSALASVHQSGTRTVGNSPAATPGNGLYTPTSAPPTEDYDSPETPGTYASPFLHFTHRQAPKETHVADVDVDPVSGRKLINHYEIIDELGRGTHGKVKLGRDLHTENTFVAIKIVERYSKRRKLGKLVSAAEDKVKKEVAILKKVRHPNIVALLEVIDDPSRKKVYIVLEYVERGEIRWRTTAPKEIAIVEARRYERERNGKRDAQSLVEDEAVLLEAQRRLAKEKRRRLRERRAYLRQLREENPDDQNFSNELGGDDMSETSEDDKLSRISTSTSVNSALYVEERRGSRAPSPLPPLSEAPSPCEDTVSHFLPLTEETYASPIREPGAGFPTGLEGTMYGPYQMSSTDSSRANSLRTGHSRSMEPVDFAHLAHEVLESELNPELMYVPVLTMQQTRVAFRDTLLGLQYLHYQGIVHRDIKPPNLLQTGDHRVKISDFGVSYLGRPLTEGEAAEDVSEHEAQDFDEAKELAKTVGTPAFYAPELCITDPGDDPLPVTKAIDIWALGITLFCMLFGRTPFVDNEFVMMRQIADEEIYIPRKRLLPVNEKPSSRPSSHHRGFNPTQPGCKRDELDLVYEDVDDELHDLLRRLLTKDPRKRISLEEIRHHAWLVADLPDKVKWLEETDPGRQSHGKKIEVSNEDVKSAVIPLQWVERARSTIKKVTDRLGFGGSKSTPRGRASSNQGIGAPSGNAASPAGSASSSSSTLNQDGRSGSLHGDGDIFTALKASRHNERSGEHPLSRSVAASPETERSAGFFDKIAVNSESARLELESKDVNRPPRPHMLERPKTLMSTAGSIRTLKQEDISRGRESPPPSPGLPGTPIAMESLGGSSLQSILGSGTARLAFKNLRERSTPRRPEMRAESKDRGSVSSLDVHGEPTLALSQTSAEGEVNLPEALREPGYMRSDRSYPNSVQNSPVRSRAPSIASSPHDRLHPHNLPAALSRTSSAASLRSINAPQLARTTSHHARQHHQKIVYESSAEDWQRAEDEHIRKLIREGREDEAGKRVETFADRTCPPSPDDQAQKRDLRRPSAVETALHDSSQPSPTSGVTQLPPAMVSSTSDFGSAMSMSHPSYPTISEASSIDPADGLPLEAVTEKAVLAEDLTEQGYLPEDDQCLDSDDGDYDSSSDSDGGLMMNRRRSKTSHNGGGNGGLTTSDTKERRGTNISKKSSRSGSNNTMKKVRTRESEVLDE